MLYIYIYIYIYMTGFKHNFKKQLPKVLYKKKMFLKISQFS